MHLFRREACVTDEKQRLHTSLLGVRTKQQLDDTICAFVDKVTKKVFDFKERKAWQKAPGKCP